VRFWKQMRETGSGHRKEGAVPSRRTPRAVWPERRGAYQSAHAMSPAAETVLAGQAVQVLSVTEGTFATHDGTFATVVRVQPHLLTPQYVRVVVRLLALGSVMRLVYGAVTALPASLAVAQHGSPSSSPLLCPSPSLSASQKAVVQERLASAKARPNAFLAPPPPAAVCPTPPWSGTLEPLGIFGW
jgi:hypothetical protein